LVTVFTALMADCEDPQRSVVLVSNYWCIKLVVVVVLDQPQRTSPLYNVAIDVKKSLLVLLRM
jgi:hypothetical protein